MFNCKFKKISRTLVIVVLINLPRIKPPYSNHNSTATIGWSNQMWRAEPVEIPENRLEGGW